MEEAEGPRPGPGRPSVFDGEQVAVFLAAVARGALVREAAAEAGVNVSTLYYHRKHDPAFAASWEAAMAAGPQPVRKDKATGRTRRRSRGRPIKFSREAKQAFLDHFAGSCDLEASAAAAGISASTVHRHLASDPAFAEGFDEALLIGYRLVEAGAVREVRAAQQKYRLAPKSDAAGAQSFERAIQLMRYFRRPGGAVAHKRQGPQARSRWTFDEAMEALQKKLAAFEKNKRRRSPPPASAGVAQEAPPPPYGRSPSPPNGGEE